ncbi:MAG TPA: hypothetical protein VMT30_06935 [Candidatus Saccharimonadia bacterium]|nr:hypothetical protein [Candidatus Saccharimonadia bacterium]
MYAGFISPKRVVKSAGIHQRLDSAAYKMIAHYLPDDAFPELSAILSFEGYNGPDGLNSKIGLRPKGSDPTGQDNHNPSHLYDPVSDSGEVPMHIATHYRGLVECLGSGDMIRAAFEAAWLAHYVGDGLTPAHHFPLEDKIAEAAAKASRDLEAGRFSQFAGKIRKNWDIWGAKGHMTTHQNFELGIAFALLVFPIKPQFDDQELGRARQLGPVEYFKNEAREIAELDLYDRFYKEGWNNDIASMIKRVLAPKAARTIGLIWLLALLEAGQRMVTAEPPA